MSKTTNKVSPEVRARAVRMVAEHAGEHASHWAAIVSISAKISVMPVMLQSRSDTGLFNANQIALSARM